VAAVLSFLAYVIVEFIESYGLLESIPAQYQVWPHVVGNATSWAVFFLLPVLCLIPDVTVKYLQRQLFPSAWQILQEKYSDQTSTKENPYMALGDETGEDHIGRTIPLIELEDGTESMKI